MSALIRVLVVDDHFIVRRALATLLVARNGMQMVGEAADGEEAIAKARQLRPDVIVMDLSMPKLGGLGAIRHIRDEDPTARILVLTSFEEDSIVVEAVTAGALGYLGKDSSADELLLAIRKIAAGAAHMPPEVINKLVRELQNPAKISPNYTTLTEREIDILAEIAKGMSNQQISENLFISVSTVRTHVSALLVKLGASSRTQAALHAVRSGALLNQRFLVGH